MARRQRDELLAPAGEERVAIDDERLRALVATSVAKAVSISCSLLAFTTWSSSPSLRAASCASRVSGSDVGIGRIDEQANDGSVGHRFVQHLQPDCHRGRGEEAHAGDVAARPVEARDEPELDRVAADPKHDRDRRGRRLGRQRRSGCRPRRSRPPAGEPDRRPAPAADRIGFQRIGSRSRRCGPRRSPCCQGPGETPPHCLHEAAREPLRRYPTTGIAGCCAPAASGHAAAAPPRRVMKSRRLMQSIPDLILAGMDHPPCPMRKQYPFRWEGR